MKIAIPVEKKDVVTNMSSSFGRTPYYAVYESDKKAFNFIDNAAAESPGGAGIKAAQLLVDQDVDVVILPQCGKNAGEVLVGAGVSIYVAKETLISDIIMSYTNDALEPLAGFHPGHHGKG